MISHHCRNYEHKQFCKHKYTAFKAEPLIGDDIHQEADCTPYRQYQTRCINDQCPAVRQIIYEISRTGTMAYYGAYSVKEHQAGDIRLPNIVMQKPPKD
ncbi:MAG: hypothetical protein IKQ61_11975 [Spirochaetales bacterium]|nr:hypothetical protein [Spirochaetales bacterium]